MADQTDNAQPVPEGTVDEILASVLESQEEEAQEQEQEESTPQRIRLGEQEFDPEELADLVEKGRDYTRKTQALAEERKAIEPIKEVYETFMKLSPDQQQRVVAAINGSPGGNDTPMPTGIAQALKDANYEDDIVAAFAAIEQRNQQLETIVSSILPEFKNFVREVRGDTEARTVSERMQAEYGITVKPEDLRKAQAETKIEDLEAAWLKANKAALLSGAVKARAKPGPKPRTPEGESKGFDIGNATADEIFDAVQRGLIEIPKKT